LRRIRPAKRPPGPPSSEPRTGSAEAPSRLTEAPERRTIGRCDTLKGERRSSWHGADIISEIDWTQCELIEQIPGKVSGRPIVRGTRILPDAIVNGYDARGTLDDIHEDYPGLSIPQIQRLIEFAHARRGQPVP
jgi:uncharacterized protein (DUF433 family)